MMMVSLPTLSVKFSQQHRTCILDPTLALSRYGLPLVKQLGTVMELWLGREFWRILDNTQFYLQHPELLLLNNAVPANTLDRSSPILQDIIRSLQEWEQIRRETDLVNLQLFWVGDRSSESWLPRGIEPEIIWRYEALARSLDSQIVRELDASETLASVFCDTAALAATLGSSFILTHQSLQESTDSRLPGICSKLESWGIPCQVVTLQDEMVTIERDYLRQLFVQLGLSKFCWAGLRLNVFHLLVPLAPQSSSFHNSETNFWEGSHGFWYQL